MGIDRILLEYRNKVTSMKGFFDTEPTTQAKHQLLEYLLSKMPKEKKEQSYSNGMSIVGENTGYGKILKYDRQGHNQCLKEIKATLKKELK